MMLVKSSSLGLILRSLSIGVKFHLAENFECLKRTRAKNDVQLAFSYFHYLNEQENFNKTVLDGNRNGSSRLNKII